MSNNLKDFINLIVNLDEKLGFKKIVKYSIMGLAIIALINYKTIVRDIIEVVTEITDDIHNEKMELRSQLLGELRPLLIEFRSDTKADRVLYLEYHNSKENLVGIPFKYIELVLQSYKHGISPVNESQYKDINAGVITGIYEEIKLGNIIACNGPNDNNFLNRYPGMYEFLNSRDGSKRQVYISIPGINQPVGIIILEWMNESEKELHLDEIIKTATQNYIPRINALILSKRK